MKKYLLKCKISNEQNFKAQDFITHSFCQLKEDQKSPNKLGKMFKKNSCSAFFSLLFRSLNYMPFSSGSYLVHFLNTRN